MSTNPANFPRNLQLEAWMEYCLQSSVEEWQTTALNELKKADLTAGILEILENFRAKNPGESARKAVAEILAAAEARKKLFQLDLQEFTPESAWKFLGEFEKVFEIEVSSFIRRPPPESVLAAWRSKLLGETSPALQQLGLTVLARFGKSEDGSLAVPFLSSENAPVAKAAIDLLQAQNLNLFKVQVSFVLASTNLDVSLHAIRRLGLIDAPEAVKFLTPLMGSLDAKVRHQALPEAMLLPFEETERIFLNFLGREKNPLLLVLASSAVILNPHRNLPLHLYDILLLSRGVKAHILQLALNTTLQSIKVAGILSEAPETYLENLKRQLQKHREMIALRLAVRNLSSANPGIRLQAVIKLKPFAGHSQVRPSLESRFETETDAEVKNALSEILGKELLKNLSVEVLIKEIESGNFLALDPKLQLALIAQVRTPEDFAKTRKCLTSLSSAELKKSVFIELIETIGLLGDSSDGATLCALLKHQDPGILCWAIRAIGKLYFDGLLLNFQQLLQHEDPRVRSAVVEALIETDKEAAINQLQAMLRTQSMEMRHIHVSKSVIRIDPPPPEPHSIISLVARCGALCVFGSNLRVDACVYADRGVLMPIGMDCTIDGNLVVNRFNREDLGGTLEIQYNSGRTRTSMLSFIRPIAKYDPTRYIVSFSKNNRKFEFLK